jgi:hypothetical protein
LLGAGVIGAALALAGTRPAEAGASTGLSESDLTLAGFAIALELTARDLYDAAIEAGAGVGIWSTMREQHAAYAQRLSGIAGIPATLRDDTTYDELVDRFATSDPSEVAYELEDIAAATHTELIGLIDDVNLAAAMASIVSMESRHALVMAALSGVDDFDVLFSNTAAPLSPEG